MNMNDDVPQSDAGTSRDLEQLREILYGSRSQDTEQRLNELEKRLEVIYQELQNSLGPQATSPSGTDESLNQANPSIYQRLGQQIGDLRQQLADFRTESRERDAELRRELLRLGNLLDKQNIGQTELVDWLVELSRQSKESSQNLANDSQFD